MDAQVGMMLRTGCTREEAFEPYRDHTILTAYIKKVGGHYGWLTQKAPWDNRQFVKLASWYAARGDEAGFVAVYEAFGGVNYDRIADELLDMLDQAIEAVAAERPGPSKRLELLDIARRADDTTPDGADVMTAWLEAQFRKAA